MTPAIEALIFEACLRAAIAMGDELKELSWFSKNWNRLRDGQR